MGDDVRIGSISGSVFAIGPNSRVVGSAFAAGAEDDALRTELAALAGVLASRPPSPAVVDARMRVQQLDEAVAEEAEPSEVRRSWSKLQSAAAELAVAANLAQIGSFVQPFLG